MFPCSLQIIIPSQGIVHQAKVCLVLRRQFVLGCIFCKGKKCHKCVSSFLFIFLNLTHPGGNAMRPKEMRFVRRSHSILLSSKWRLPPQLRKAAGVFLHPAAPPGNVSRGQAEHEEQPLGCPHPCQHPHVLLEGLCTVLHTVGCSQAASGSHLSDCGTYPARSLEKLKLSLSCPQRKTREQLALYNSRTSSGGPVEN